MHIDQPRHQRAPLGVGNGGSGCLDWRLGYLRDLVAFNQHVHALAEAVGLPVKYLHVQKEHDGLFRRLGVRWTYPDRQMSDGFGDSHQYSCHAVSPHIESGLVHASQMCLRRPAPPSSSIVWAPKTTGSHPAPDYRMLDGRWSSSTLLMLTDICGETRGKVLTAAAGEAILGPWLRRVCNRPFTIGSGRIASCFGLYVCPSRSTSSFVPCRAIFIGIISRIFACWPWLWPAPGADIM